jgi:hypothetical protein
VLRGRGSEEEVIGLNSVVYGDEVFGGGGVVEGDEALGRGVFSKGIGLSSTMSEAGEKTGRGGGE